MGMCRQGDSVNSAATELNSRCPLITSLISRPTPTRLTLDLGYKAVASDCPTVALHRSAYVIVNGEVSGTWDVATRDRVLSV
jgi:hypothetical protein